MPTPSANPKRLQVIDRTIVVLQAITAGADYWFTPYAVIRSQDILPQIAGYPVYAVYIDSGEPHRHAGEQQYDETFTLVVEGIIQNQTDPITVAEKALRDVRKAVNADSINPAAGTLNTLIVNFNLGATEMAYDEKGFGWFYQRFLITISGDYGEI